MLKRCGTLVTLCGTHRGVQVGALAVIVVVHGSLPHWARKWAMTSKWGCAIGTISFPQKTLEWINSRYSFIKSTILALPRCAANMYSRCVVYSVLTFTQSIYYIYIILHTQEPSLMTQKPQIWLVCSAPNFAVHCHCCDRNDMLCCIFSIAQWSHLVCGTIGCDWVNIMLFVIYCACMAFGSQTESALRRKLLSDSAAAGVHQNQQSISRTFQSVDLSQLVFNWLSVVYQLRKIYGVWNPILLNTPSLPQPHPPYNDVT